MTRAAAVLVLGLALLHCTAPSARANDTPYLPGEELKTFKVEPPMQVELVAAEPMVESPCAMAFDERGRLFVAENRGYPHDTEPPAGRIVLLESTQQDGHYDRRTVFAEGLTFPNGVLPWQGGLLVTCAPDVLWLEDTKGDGVADRRRVLLTGFDASKSTQLRVNCPTLGPDGWIYFAAGLVGGTITSPDHPEMPALKMTGDLRWNPRTGEFENVDGRAQYGLSFDDFGNRFICMNRLPVQHVVMKSAWLRRNPHLAFSDTVQDCNDRTVKTGLKGGGDGVRLYPISSNITTADSHAGSFTAACGIKIWRGGALPAAYEGCALSCDPTGNLVHVDRLVPHGATFAAEPLLAARELFASSDDWCRPVFLSSGPDGALYVCDMYRKIIEHPDYLPAEIRKHSDFDAGKRMGRIWRIAEPGRKADFARATRIVEAPDRWLGTENSWARDTAFRLELDRLWKGGHPPQIEGPSVAPTARTQATALQLRAASGRLTGEALQAAVSSELPELRAMALEFVAERLGGEVELALAKSANETGRALLFRAIALGAKHRLDLPQELSPAAAAGLATIAADASGDRWTRAAVWSGIAGSEAPLASELLPKMTAETPGAQESLEELGLLCGRAAAAEKRDPLAGEVLDCAAKIPMGLRVAFLGGAAQGAGVKLGEGSRPWVAETVAAAANLANQASAPREERLRSAALLRHASWGIAGPSLLAMVTGEGPLELHAAAIRALAAFDRSEVTDHLLAAPHWRAISPAEREATLAALLGNPMHLPRVLDAIAAGDLPRNSLSAAQRAALAKNKDAALRERAAQILGAPAEGDRKQAYEAAKGVLTLAPRAGHGREVFKAICSSCHRLDREGHQVGPDLLDIRSQPKESILLHIVVPDYEIAPGFAASTLELKDGRVLLGIVIADTLESVTLRLPLGLEENILRANIATLTASEHSLMPAGLEAAMSPQDLADLLAFLKGEP